MPTFGSRDLVATLLTLTIFSSAASNGAMASSTSNGSPPVYRPFSVDDMMKIEGLGAALADPKGRWLVYERLRPYEQSDDFSFRTYAFQKSGHQLWRYDLRKGGAPERLPGLDPMPHSYLQGFSPSGRFLAFMQYRLGVLSLGAYDMTLGKAVRFEGAPAFSRDGLHNPIWVSDEDVVFAALPKGLQPEFTSARAFTGTTLAKAWQDAWRGNVVTASEVSAMARDQSDQQQPGYLVHANARTGKSSIISSGLYGDLRPSPDRRFLAALTVSKPRPGDAAKLTEDDPRRYKLTLFDLKTGVARRLASGLDIEPYTIAWAPDGAHLAAFGWKPNESPRDGRFHVIDVKTGTVVRYDHVGLDLADERERGYFWRPERVAFLGDRLAVYARRIPPGEDQTPRFTYRDVRPSGLSAPDWYALAADGRSINLTGRLAGVSGIPVHASQGQLTVAAEDGAYRFYEDGRRRRLTPPLVGRFHFVQPGTFATREGAIRPEFTDDAVFEVRGNDYAKIVIVDLRDGHEGDARVIDAPSAAATPLTGSLAGGAVLFSAADGQVSRLLIAKSSDGDRASREIARINAPLADIALGTWKIVTYEIRDPDGKRPPKTIESCVLLPPDFKPKAPPPLVVDVYPDVGPQCKAGGQRIDYPAAVSPYLWVGRGYAYARLSTPRDLIRTAHGPIAGMPDVVNAGMDALVARGFADPQRIALYGFSQGGVSALYVAAHSSRFKAVIAMNSWADLFSHYFGTSGIYSYVYGSYFGAYSRYDRNAGSDFGIGRTPFDDPETYYRNSPVLLAPLITAPVMLIHSDMDEFAMSQFDEMYGALVRTGKDVRYVRYWGEGHSPSSPANVRDLWRRIDDFLSKNGLKNHTADKQISEGSVN